MTYLDNDQLNKPNIGNSTVYRVASSDPVSTKQFILNYPKVLSESVGLLEGIYHIRLDTSIDPVQHAQRRIPVPLRDTLKVALEDLVKQDIIAPVTEPTPWITSIVVVPKKNGALRICLYPKDFNKAILREKYSLPTIKGIVTHLHGAKVFTILEVSKGFWHVLFDEPSYFF